MRIVITGASGFVGGALVRALDHAGHEVVAVSRRTPNYPERVKGLQVSDFGSRRLVDAMRGAECVVHCAARAHVLKEQSADPMEVYRETNVRGSSLVADAAAEAAVNRFVFVSSVKAWGEETAIGRPAREEDACAPTDAYGKSKREAELMLEGLQARTGLELVIVRPPLVYGPGVRANFRALVSLVRAGVPLPLGALTENRRSFIGLANLVSFLSLCTHHPSAAGRTFFVTDQHDVSTAELIREIGSAMDRRVLLWPLSATLLGSVASVMRWTSAWRRLSGSLQLDSSRASTILGWRPPVPMSEELRRTVDHMSR